MNKVFLSRLKETGKIVGILTIWACVTIAVVYFMNHIHQLHIPREVTTIVAWICLIGICVALLYLAGILCYGLYLFIKWLFIEPFRKDNNQ